MDKRVCPCCGKEFIPTNNRQKYCGKKCLWRVQNQKKKLRKLRDIGGDCERKYYIKRIILLLLKKQRGMTLTCPECGKEFFFRVRGEHDANHFCSRECAFAWRHKHREKRNRKSDPRVAERKAFEREEREKAWHRHCAFCGKPFFSKSKRKYCSYECMVNDHKKPRTCVVCGKEFTPKVGEDSKCCSSSCRNRFEDLKRYKRNRRRDIRLRGKRVDRNITLKELSRRDHDVCWLCGKKVNWNDYTIRGNGAFIAGESYPSIDHVIPLSQGGLDEWTNVRLAHRSCNNLKNDSWFCSQIMSGGGFSFG